MLGFSPSEGPTYRLQRNVSLRGPPLRPARSVVRPRHTGRPLSAKASSDNTNSSGGSSSVLSIFCPLLKLLSGGDAAAPRKRWLEVATSGVASIARLPFGTTAGPASLMRNEDPSNALILAEFEACPFCRRVREAIVDLDLEVDVWPTPKDSIHHRQQVMDAGGKLQFPFFMDRNTEPPTQLYESEAIVRYLYDTYGGGSAPRKGLLISTLISGWIPTLLRAGRGMVRYSAAQSEQPQQQLVLWDYDGNQFSRLVREALCELELPYRRIACGKGSKRRSALSAVSGDTKCPYLIDPNTGTAIQDSEQAVSYLFATYGNAAPSTP